MDKKNCNETSNDSKKSCSYCSIRMDCDGDWGGYCCAPGSYKCGYKNYVRDCDGDIIITCLF